ncbi:hypothetical protein UCD39_24240 [Nitrospirillum sp. BR 11752]|uniref:hypothetical protein n=1 Tax=Nitrospirillum sp. BR 11752 TaxID=3104293 RepID=UPI002EB2EC53|nr:hypothetical protein [Nitrospirillum sp. BR 11752]
MTIWNQRVIRAGIALLSYFMATFFTFLPDGNGEHGLQNLFWGLLYGFGWHVSGTLTHYSHGADIFGFFIWPFIIWVIVFLTAGIGFNSSRPLRRRLVWAVLALSLCIVLPGKMAFALGFKRLPTFNNLVAAAY